MKTLIRSVLGTILGIVAALASPSLHAQTNLIPLAPSLEQPLFPLTFTPQVGLDGATLVLAGGGFAAAYRVQQDGSVVFEEDLLSLVPSALGGGSPFSVTRIDVEDDLVLLVYEGEGYYPYSVPGFCFLFEREPGGWSFLASFVGTQLDGSSPGFAPDTYFASSVGISGNRIAIGEPGHGWSGFSGPDIGVVWTYEKVQGPNGVEFTTQVISPPQPILNEGFGSGLALNGDLLAVSSRRGCVFIYRADASLPQRWRLIHILFEDGTVSDASSPPNSLGSSGFGRVMTIHAGTVFVQDFLDDSGNSQDPEIKIFQETASGGNPSSLTYRGAVRLSDGAPSYLPNLGPAYGLQLQATDDWLMVSAFVEQSWAGALYAIRRDSSVPEGWREYAKFVGEETFVFGRSMDVDGRRFVATDRSSTSAAPSIYLEQLLPLAPEPELQGFCHGDGGDQQGCQDCPCGNNLDRAAAGGCRNSTGQGTRLAVTGRPSVSDDTLRLEVGGAVPNTFALLISGAARAPVFPGAPCPAGSGILSPVLDGLLCVQTNQRRLNPRAVDANGLVGVTNAGWGAGSQSLLAQVGLAPGQTRHFQVVYRDGGTGGCGTQTNTTNGITILVQP